MHGHDPKDATAPAQSGMRLRHSIMQRVARKLGWNRSSLLYTGGLLITLVVVITHWWTELNRFFWWWKPGSPFWTQVDGFLLITLILLFLLITRGADIRSDCWILIIGLAGGAALEGWGTGTGLWTYFTGECPPLWILPAWPIASLAIDRASRLLTDRLDGMWFRKPAGLYWVVFGGYFLLLLFFVSPYLDSPLTQAAVLVQLYVVLTPRAMREHLVYFAAGAAIGCLLEFWGTTRLCWTYYTGQTPPLFAVMAHGMAAVAFSRTAFFIRNFHQESLRAASRKWIRIATSLTRSENPIE
jgi:hypothetical protein